MTLSHRTKVDRTNQQLAKFVLDTAEGVHWRAKVDVGAVFPDGGVAQIIVHLVGTFPDGSEHGISLVPSSSTDEGVGTGNVFIYEWEPGVDLPDAVTHLAWQDSTQNRSYQ